MGTDGIREALLTGRGSIKMRAVADIEEIRKGRTAIVVTELPYQVSQDRVMEKIAGLVQNKKVSGIADLHNQSSSKVGVRLVIELQRSAVPQVVLNQLYKLTQLQESFGVNTVALVDGVPQTLNIAEMVQYFLDHQMEVIERRTQFRLDRAEARAHILEGLVTAVDNIDEVVAIIRRSAEADQARTALMERFELTDIQARAVLDMPLRRLTSLETEKLRAELDDLRELIADLRAILASPARRRAIIAEELEEVRRAHDDVRRTRIQPDEGELSFEDLVADDELVLTASANGYVKTVDAGMYRSQGRGGRGVKGAAMREGDFLTHVLHTTAHAYLLFFSNKGRVHRVKAHEIPRQSRTAKGVLAQSVLPFEPDERIRAIIDTRDYESFKYLVMVTRRGQIKRTAFSEYNKSRKTLIAIKMIEGDELVEVHATKGGSDVLLFTQQGQGIRFQESEVRPLSRGTRGVRGIRLREGDEVVGASVSETGDEVLMLTSGGYGKRTRIDQFPMRKRGGLGVKAYKLTPVRGKLIGARAVSPDGKVLVVSSDGQMIKMEIGSIGRRQRITSGVRVKKLDEGVTLTSFAPVLNDEAE